jgi:DeoR/GlpR family transcriptional regulator of sugar metabolism
MIYYDFFLASCYNFFIQFRQGMHMTRPSESLPRIERLNRIEAFINKKGRASVEDICDNFQISKATARRDLDALSEAGKITRYHGGAVRNKTLTPAGSDIPVHERNQEHYQEKRAIGESAAGLVNDGDTIFLASGSTVLEIAKALHGKKITVLTNSLPVLNELYNDEAIEVISTGGILRRSELSFIGHISEKSIEEIRADKVFLGIFAIHPSTGLTHNYLPEIMTDRAIIDIGNQVIVLADHSKFTRSASAFLAPLSRVHVLVTDTQTSAEIVDQITKSGVRVILAK